MTLAIFAVGIFVFLITVYGTVVTGGMMLTDNQLDDNPELAPDSPGSDELDGQLIVHWRS